MSWRHFLTIGLWGVIPATFLLAVHLLASGEVVPIDLVAILVFVLAVLAAVYWSGLTGDNASAERQRAPRLALAGVLVCGGLAYWAGVRTLGAWLILGSLFVILIRVEGTIESGLRIGWRWLVRTISSLAVGAIVAALVQLESRFAGEEFYAALEAVVMGVVWFLLVTVSDRLSTRGGHDKPRVVAHPRTRVVIAVGATVSLLLFGIVTGIAYQNSFYPDDAPTYAGVSGDAPFLCGEVEPSNRAYTAENIWRKLLSAVESNPNLGVAETGMLALATHDAGWAEAFREGVLREADAMLFTGAAHSLKSAQYLAAFRVYYFAQVRRQFPDLFREQDTAALNDWFSAINRRALRAEWVDWLYGLALSKMPEGPYENQESGAALLSLLEAYDLAAPELSNANRAYLDRATRGWRSRFRNPDDAFVYQPEWLTNAYFQSIHSPDIDEHKRELAFEWLLLQMLPDGSAPIYNHPVYPLAASAAYLGAVLLEDARFVWLSGHALDSGIEYLHARPGAESFVFLDGQSPMQGSCLIFGDSGLPNQIGPLAPDKIVFRSGWDPEDTYLLLNLRFTGWHRYKATNTVPAVYIGGRIVADVLRGTPSRWLPEGRRLFRDKRIPRENLSGLLIQNDGFSVVLHALTGIGSRWAQDPPYYAEVIDFRTGDVGDSNRLDSSLTRVLDWRGWDHDRRIFFYHDGPIVVLDRAAGPNTQNSAVVWHLTRAVERVREDPARFRLLETSIPIEVAFLSLDFLSDTQPEIMIGGNEGNHSLYFIAPENGSLKLATVFLPEEWVTSNVRVEMRAGETYIVIAASDQRRELLLPE